MFHIGQKVVRVKDDAARNGRRRGTLSWPDTVRNGRILTIRDIDMRYVDWYGVAGLRFEEVSFPHKEVLGVGPVEPAFPADQFRPVTERKTDISVFQEIARKVSKPKRAPLTT
jgi:hypothetical protein